MEKATEIFLNQGITGAVAVLFLLALIFVGKLLLKEKDLRTKELMEEKDLRINELQERLEERRNETHQTFMDYLATVHTLVENSTRTVEKFADIVAPLKTFLDILINKK